jgi:hypothetical protein
MLQITDTSCKERWFWAHARANESRQWLRCSGRQLARARVPPGCGGAAQRCTGRSPPLWPAGDPRRGSVPPRAPRQSWHGRTAGGSARARACLLLNGLHDFNRRRLDLGGQTQFAAVARHVLRWVRDEDCLAALADLLVHLERSRALSTQRGAARPTQTWDFFSFEKQCATSFLATPATSATSCAHTASQVPRRRWRTLSGRAAFCRRHAQNAHVATITSMRLPATSLLS